jgi:FKBP-type peptidyl-prolyl cis-trans isomerase FkpA
MNGRIMVLGAALAVAALAAACGKEPVATVKQDAPAGVTALQIEQIQAGDGPAIQPGQQAVVHYTGWLYDPSAPESKGEKFDSSRDRGQTFSFPLGAGRVIRGWDQGVAGMQVGERRLLLIPSELAYGARGAGGVIPPGATLVFDVELIEIQ